VLERAAVPITHEVVDQPDAPVRVGIDLVEGLLPRSRDPGGEQDVGVARGGAHELDRHVRAELDRWLGTDDGLLTHPANLSDRADSRGR